VRVARREVSLTARFGQSTCLIQLHGVSVLTDPVFGDKPLDTFASPRRIRPLPCTLSQLLASGRIDVVLVSHKCVCAALALC